VDELSKSQFRSDLLMGCGCHFIDGVAVNMCTLAEIRDGSLFHELQMIKRNTEDFIASVSKQPADVEELERLYRL